jgi:BNR repeat-like domain
MTVHGQGRRRVAARALALVILAAAFVAAPAASAKRPVELVRLSADPYTDATSQHRTEVEPDSFAFGRAVVGAFQVGRTFSGGSSNNGWATSTDGGKTFASGFLPGITTVAGGPWDVASDPSVAYDAAHDVWLISSLAVLRSGPRAIVVSRSADGLHWSDPVTAVPPVAGAIVDKNWTVCDNHRSSPFFGHCYTQYDDFGDADRIKMTTSTDGGLTWSAPANTAGNDLGIAGQPVVQPDGTVIVPISNLVFSALQSFRSTDGGQTWSAAVPVTPTPHHPVAAGLRSATSPSAEVDRAGTVYAAWHDCRFRTGCSANDIVMSTTTDGLSWSPVTRIPIDAVDSGADHFISGLAVDPHSARAHARLALSYYSYPNANCTVATCELTVGFISSRDGGRSWSAPTQLAGPMRVNWLADTSQGRMVGDYISTSFIGKTALPLFAVAGPPNGGLFDEAIATIPGGMPVKRPVP